MCFDLNEEAYKNPLYIHAQSNHPPIIKKHLLQMIGQRISDLSCDKVAFEKAAPEYNQALQRSGFKYTIMYKPLQSPLHRSNNNNKKKRKRNIIWFNPSFSENVATNIGKEFFSLLSKHFPPNNRHHKIFNKQNVKLSYCTAVCPTWEASLLNIRSRCSIGFHRRTLKHHPAIAAAISVIVH